MLRGFISAFLIPGLACIRPDKQDVKINKTKSRVFGQDLWCRAVVAPVAISKYDPMDSLNGSKNRSGAYTNPTNIGPKRHDWIYSHFDKCAECSHPPFAQWVRKWESLVPTPTPASIWCPVRQCEAHRCSHPAPEEEDAGCWSCTPPGACGVVIGGS